MDKEPLHQELEKKEEIIDALSTALRNNRHEVKRLNEEILNLREEIKGRNELVQQIQTSKDEIQTLKAETDYLRTKLIERNELVQQLENGKDEVNTFKAENDDLRAELKGRNELVQQLKNSKDEIQRLKAETDNLRAELKGRIELVQQLKNSKDDIQKLKAETDNLKAELKGRNEHVQQLQHEKEALTLKLDTEKANSQRKRDAEFGSESFCSYERKKATKQASDSWSKSHQRQQQLYRGLQKRKRKSVVAAIDIGPTRSGSVFSYNHDYKIDPLKISSCMLWYNTANMLKPVVPTTILLDENKKCVAFGYEADDRHEELVYREEHEKYYYFRRFNRIPFSMASASKNSKDIIISDEHGKKVRALTVLSIAIKYLMDSLMECLNKRTADGTTVDEVEWVITVPVSWTSEDDELMRQSALEAGIDSENLILVLRPDALMTYHLEYGRKYDKETVFKNGSKYMLLDFTEADQLEVITYEIVQNTPVALNYGHFPDCGESRVDFAFEKFLFSIVGRSAFAKFREEYPDDSRDFYMDFETRTRSVTSDTTQDQFFRLPSALLDTYRDVTRRTLKEAVDEFAPNKGKITIRRDKLKIDAAVFKSLFDESISNTIKNVKNMLDVKSSAGIDTFLMGGQFSENTFLQEAIRQQFPDKRVIIPENPGMAGLLGAPLFGHEPFTVQS